MGGGTDDEAHTLADEVFRLRHRLQSNDLQVVPRLRNGGNDEVGALGEQVQEWEFRRESDLGLARNHRFGPEERYVEQDHAAVDTVLLE